MSYSHKVFRHLLDRQFSVLLGILAVSGAGLVLLRGIPYGVGLGEDSLEYISVAQSLLEGEGLTRYSGNTLTRYPPLYPIILGWSSFFYLDPFDIASLLNAILFGSIVFMVGRWLHQHLISRLLVLWGCFMLMFSVPTTEIASYAMAETLYLLFAISALIQADNFFRNHNHLSLIWSAILTALACITRFTGVSIVATVVVLLFLKRGTLFKEKLVRIVMYLCISLLPAFVWLLRTYVSSGSVAGNRTFRTFSLPLVMEAIYDEMVLQSDPVWWTIILLPSLTILVGFLVLSNSGFNHKTPWYGWHTVLIFCGCALIYMIMMFISFFTEIPGNDILLYDVLQTELPRYMLPIYIPLLIAGLMILDRVLNYQKIGWQNIPVALVLFIFLVYQIVGNVSSIRASNNLGFGYSNRRWDESEALKYIRDIRSNGIIHSNYAAPIYAHTDTLAKYRYLPCERSELETSILSENADLDTYILWFYDSDQTCEVQGSYGLNDLFNVQELEAVALLADGVLFRLNKGTVNTEPYRLHRLRYESVVANAPLIRSVFDVYVADSSISYVREQCSPGDTEPSFFLHIIPVDADDLPNRRQSSGFDNLDFHFDDLNVNGLKFNGKCLVMIPLPDYDIARIRTGQWISSENRNLWQEEVSLR